MSVYYERSKENIPIFRTTSNTKGNISTASSYQYTLKLFTNFIPKSELYNIHFTNKPLTQLGTTLNKNTHDDYVKIFQSQKSISKSKQWITHLFSTGNSQQNPRNKLFTWF